MILDKHNDKYMWFAFGGIIFGGFMVMLDTSIVNVAIPKMMMVFGATTNQIQWVLTGYMLTMAIVIPLARYLIDRYGNKRIYIFALIAFTIGSTLCWLATSTEILITARVIQAIGAGMLLPVGMSVLLTIIPKEKRGLALGSFGAVTMAAPAIGPILGGYIVQDLNWRLIFAINVPVGILGVTLVILYLQDSGELQRKPFDFLGAITAALGFYTLLFALSNGIEKGWTSPYIIFLFATSIISLCVFVYIELKHREPLFELKIFKTLTFALSTILSSIITIVMFGVVFLIPLYMQNLRGYSPVQTGAILLFCALGAGVMMVISGKIYDKFGAKWVTIGGVTLIVIGSYHLSKLSLNTDYTTIGVTLTLIGIGMGLTVRPIQLAGMSYIPKNLLVRAMELNSSIRLMTGSIGIVMVTTIFRHRSIFHGARFSENVNLGSAELSKAQIVIQNAMMNNGMNPANSKGLVLEELKRMVSKQITMTSMSDTFLIVTFIVCIGIPLALLLRKNNDKVEDLGDRKELQNMKQLKPEIEVEII